MWNSMEDAQWFITYFWVINLKFKIRFFHEGASELSVVKRDSPTKQILESLFI